jgi:hypothetical protein
LQKKGGTGAVALSCGFVLAVSAAVGLLWYFYQVRAGRTGRFVLSAWLTLVCSSVLYTPFSYGVSRYSRQASAGRGSVADLFYLFHRPVLLAKAVFLSVFKNLAVWTGRMLLLAAVAWGETVLGLVRMALRGEASPAAGERLVQSAAEGMAQSRLFAGASFVLWGVGLVGLGWISLRYLGCKYLLLRFPEMGVWQALRIGRRAATARRFLGFFTAGCRFSVYAERVAEAAWRADCRSKSLRKC